MGGRDACKSKLCSPLCFELSTSDKVYLIEFTGVLPELQAVTLNVFPSRPAKLACGAKGAKGATAFVSLKHIRTRAPRSLLRYRTRIPHRALRHYGVRYDVSPAELYTRLGERSIHHMQELEDRSLIMIS